MDLLGAIVSSPSVNGAQGTDAKSTNASPTPVVPGFGHALAHALARAAGARLDTDAAGRVVLSDTQAISLVTTRETAGAEALRATGQGALADAARRSATDPVSGADTHAVDGKASVGDVVRRVQHEAVVLSDSGVAHPSLVREQSEQVRADTFVDPTRIVGDDVSGHVPAGPRELRNETHGQIVQVHSNDADTQSGEMPAAEPELAEPQRTALQSESNRTDQARFTSSKPVQPQPSDATAAHNANTSAPDDSSAIERSSERLVPAFRARLERVIERMREEFGYEVRVVETWRSQERQDLLYAQGRTAPGRTVTWTQHSNHTTGRAADVMIDGGYDNVTAFARLAKLANEEGLRTLAGDPGHIEMQRGNVAGDAVASGALVGQPRALRAASNGSAIAQVAAVANNGPFVAQVAAVARPAHVAQVAHTARVADTAAPRSNTRPVDREPMPSNELRTDVPDVTATRFVQTKPDAPVVEPRIDVTLPNATTPGGIAVPDVAVPTESTSIAARVARVFALRDAMESAPTTGITFTVDDAQGTAARIRLGMRAAAVNATLDVADPIAARDLQAHIGELQRALEAQGVEARALSVRNVAHTSDAGEITRPLGAALVQDTGASNRTGSDTHNDRSPGSPRREFASPEHRHKRQNKENSP